MKTLTFDNGKEFSEHSRIDTATQSTTYFTIPLQAGNEDQMKTPMEYCVNTAQKRPLSTVTVKELRKSKKK